MLSKNTILFFALLWTLTITVLSLIGVGSFGSFASNFNIAYKDKIVHFIFYFVLVLFWLRYFDKAKIKNWNNKILLATIVYGILIEICQGVFTKNREADIFDALVNAIGAFSGYLLMKMLSNNDVTTKNLS